ncbi:hypothetical protein KTH44_21990 [Acinetobacter bereziniae]|uniref:hypothetical protein n=1 Tax=Acinetobacter bereziniae TaxID=106648 RepID=UPI0021CDBEF5|nr:hypothetical protein [Acinetobacter bereziniae]MCU4321770.1 hypothetical protein [Acinetobacter bereziniae]
MVGVLSLLAPYEQSFAYDQLEQDIKNIFIDVFNELYSNEIEDLHFYGMPHLGSANVVERFTKQDGLAVLRRPDSSDKLMRVIYSTWRSLASKRGFAFLEFLLQTLWANQWKIQRVYHSIAMADLYPTVATVQPIEESFLTSRIMITLDADVDFAEVSELAPTLFRLVPANIVAQITSEQPLGDFDNFGIGMVMVPFMTGNFFSFDPITSDNPPEWTDWMVMELINITPTAGAIYKAYKTNLIETLQSTARVELAIHILNQLSKQEYRDLQGAKDACAVLTKDYIGYKWDVGNLKIIAHSLPNQPDLVKASRILLNRFYASKNGNFVGSSEFTTAVSRVGWVIIGEDIYKIYQTPTKAYKSGNFYSLVSFEDAFNLNLQDQIINNSDLIDAKLGAVDIKSETATQVEYIQHYTKTEIVEPEPPITNENEPETPENSETEPTEPITIEKEYQLLITVELVDNPAYDPLYDGQAIKLTIDVLETLLNEVNNIYVLYSDQFMYDLLQKALKFAYSEDSVFFNNDLYIANLKDFSFDQIKQTIIENLNATHGGEYKVGAENFIRKIANTVFEANIANQIVKYLDLVPIFNQNQVAV